MNIKKHLKKKHPNEDKVLIHTWVDKNLRDKVNKQRLSLALSWSDIQEAMYKAFLEEDKK